MFISNFFRKLLFSDIKKIILLSKKKLLQAEDLPDLPRNLDPRHVPLDPKLVSTKNARSLVFSLYRAGYRFLLPALGLNLLYVMFNLVKPLLVHGFVSLVSLPMTKSNFRVGLLYTLAFGLCSICGSLALQHYFLRMLGSYQIFTNFLNEKIFRHSLFLTQEARLRIPLGDIVNHMSSDSDSIADLGMVSGDLLISSLTLSGVTLMLFYYLGTTAFVAIILLLLLAPLTKWVAKRFSSLEKELMKNRDQRVTLMSQALNGIRVVKYFAWERSMLREVGVVRKEELLSRKRLARTEAVAMLSYSAVSTIVLFASLAVHVLRGRALDPALVFTCVSLFAQMEEPFGQLSSIISRLTNAFVSAGRICLFLQQAKLDHKVESISSTESLGLKVVNLSFRYTKNEQNILNKVSFSLNPGESMAIVGAVGVGKSTLLQAILGELQLESGKIDFLAPGERQALPRIAYVPQEAYIINGSLKENILFGEKSGESALNTALEATCLITDLQQLPAGLNTEIGEKGVNLSGGQKQRVSLARAVMHRPNLVLLDDPLSAVDMKTETLLVDRLLFGIWNTTTRIVVTHRLAHLRRFQKIAFLSKAGLVLAESLDALIVCSPEFAAFYAEQGDQEQEMALHSAELKDTIAAPKVEDQRVTEDEDRAIGAVKASVYFDYLRALGGRKHRKIVLAALLMGSFMGALMPLIQRSWLAYASNLQANMPVATFSVLARRLALVPMQSIWVYGILGFSTLVVTLGNRLLWLERGVAAGADMHDQMLFSILKAPLRFFDSTPVGRILQRFSRDVESVDIQLQWSFETTVRCLVHIITAMALILAVLPAMVLVMLPVLVCYYFLQLNYRIPAREAKRLDSISRSPRYAHFKETLQGLPVIRGFGKTNYFMESFYDHLAHNQKMFYGVYMLNRWFSSRIPLLGAFISIATALGVLFYARSGEMSAGMAGLVIVYSLSFWESLNWAVRIFSEVEARMTAVERLSYYGSIVAERNIIAEPLEIADTWPSRGGLEFHEVVARYAPHLPNVLKGVSFSILPGERVGIIGRTGSGKSTILQTLFRFMELDSGWIKLDGLNIASVPLERLRKCMAMIPQDPTLFLGTIRNNLDRYEEHTDEEIWNDLARVKLKDIVRIMPEGLSAPVQENGGNFSQGQRQLFCLARALLCGVSIIVMDEATASVDVQTDAMVQQVLRESCCGITMLIIAHRLGTVSDCDQIIEIRDGVVHRNLQMKKHTTESKALHQV